MHALILTGQIEDDRKRFVGIIIMGVIAIALDLGLRWLQTRCIPWVGRE